MCKVGKLPGINQEGAEVESNKTKSSGKVKGFWKKIRTFGGKKVGAEG